MRLAGVVRFMFDREHGVGDRLIARWLFLRAMGGIYFAAFLALVFQARGLVGTAGILPAQSYLAGLRGIGALRFWYAPTLLWFHSGISAAPGPVQVGRDARRIIIGTSDAPCTTRPCLPSGGSWRLFDTRGPAQALRTSR